MSTTLSQHEVGYVKGLMLMSCFRGMFGAGSIVVRPHQKKLYIEKCKTELCAAELAFDPEFVKHTSASPKIIATHARAPTKGGNGIEFVHPHRHDNITGVHNGTMFTVMKESISDKHSDSSAIFKAIQEHGVEEFIKNSRGAYALIWTDTKDSTLNFLRNDQRPLWFARVGHGDFANTMYWSSEKGMLEYVLTERGSISTNAITFIQPKPWLHIRFPLDVKAGCFPLTMKQYDDPHPVTYTYTKHNYQSSVFDDYAEVIAEADRQDLPPEPPPRVQVPAVRPAWTPPPRMNVVNARSLPKVEDILSRRQQPQGGASDEARFPNNATELLGLIRSGCCVICEDQPKITGNKVPKVFPIRFGSGSHYQYICDDCVVAQNPIALSVLGASVDIRATKH